MLDLKTNTDCAYQKYMVIHQFGHALGLEHEHQRKDFWDAVQKYIDLERMRSDPRIGNYGDSLKAFVRDWLPFEDDKTYRETAYKYDPQSIMHWW